ncbi:MAG TPA: DUF2993 domain-containing protein [Pseudolysinimonas sp.]|nr:DUF2993 domain-containing protein [Pseudolysinimonas sp.]
MSDDTTPKKPAPKKPAAKPAAKKPAAKKPAAEKPAAAKAPAGKPAAKKPAAAETKPVPKVAAPSSADAAATEVIAPAEPAVASAETATTPEPEVVVVDAPKKKRKRWPFVVGGVVLLLVILGIVGFFVADNYAKNYATGYIKQRIVAVLGLPEDAPVDVKIGGGSVLLQALAGKLESVDVAADDVTFGTLSGSARLHAAGVPLDETAATQTLEVTFTLPEDQVVAAMSSDVSGFELESVVLEEPEIVVSTTLDLFFFQLPVSLGLVPTADEGLIVLTPENVTLADKDYTADELREQLGELAGPLLAEQRMCVKDALPVALTIVDVDVVKSDLVLKIDGDGAVLGGEEMATLGTCAVG